MEHGGLATIFEKHDYFICNDEKEYVEKALKFLDDNKKNDYEDIIKKYTDIAEWKNILKKVYGNQ